MRSSELSGRTALITGATSGIGRAIAVALAEAGVRVIASGRREERLQEVVTELGANSVAIPVDLRRQESMDAMFNALEALDILINCAGVAPKAPVLAGGYEQFSELLEVNVLALAYCAQRAVRLFAPDGGHIINVSSMSGHRVPPSGGFYAATKFAVRALTDSLRYELKAAGDKTRVACISPGFVDTPLLDTYFKGNEHELAKLKSGLRMLEPEDVAASVLHLLQAPAHVEIGDILLRPSDQSV
ncbi:MAG: SDR family oxidoreductase [Verrucomicrobiales bacterium]